MKNSNIYVVVTAAGSGQRLGAEIPKALVPLAGTPLFIWTIQEISKIEGLCGGVVTAPVDYIADFRQYLAEFGSQIGGKWQVVPGGNTRRESIYRGLTWIKENYLLDSPEMGNNGPQDLVLIHDAARALTPQSVFEKVITALKKGCEVVTPALPVADTIRLVAEEKVGDRNGWELAGEDVPRNRLRIVQTPQGFRFNTIFALHQQWSGGENLPEATDDAQMASAAGYRQVFVPGHPNALKITVPEDLDFAGYLLTKRQN